MPKSAAESLALRDKYDELLDEAIDEPSDWVAETWLPLPPKKMAELEEKGRSYLRDDIKAGWKIAAAHLNVPWLPDFVRDLERAEKALASKKLPTAAPVPARLSRYVIGEMHPANARSSRMVGPDLTVYVQWPTASICTVVQFKPKSRQLLPFAKKPFVVDDYDDEIDYGDVEGYRFGALLDTPQVDQIDWRDEVWRFVVAPSGSSTRQSFSRIRELRV